MIVNFRYKRFEKAFLLAVDIGAKDLFMVSCSPIFIILLLFLFLLFFSLALPIKLKTLPFIVQQLKPFIYVGC